MFFDQRLVTSPENQTTQGLLLVGQQRVPLLSVRNPRARRYVLRLSPDGTARVTLPRGGSPTAAWEFVTRHTAWLERQFERLRAQPRTPIEWHVGTEILFRGEMVPIAAGVPGWIQFGTESIRIGENPALLRSAIERHLRHLAARELPPQVMALAAREGLTVRRVMVRNQRSRWGSCSRRGTISLNWRLIQTPPFVQTYICLHEILHLREMNHSARFWRAVERVCPDYRTAEHWLKQHSELLR